MIDPVHTPKKLDPRKIFGIVAAFSASAAFYFSGLFTLLAPLPLSMVVQKKGPLFWFACAVINTLWIYLVSGPTGAALFAGTVVPFSALIGWACSPKLPDSKWPQLPLEKRVLIIWGVAIFLCGAFVATYPHGWSGLKLEFDGAVEYLKQNLPQSSQNELFGEEELGEWKQRAWVQIPFSLATLLYFVVWLHMVLLQSRKKDRAWVFTWRQPDFFIWLVALGVAAAIWGWNGPYQWAAEGFLRLLAMLYGIQGFAILTSFLTIWKIRGFWRFFIYFLLVSGAVPVLPFLGLTDFWLDYRKRIKVL